MTVRWTVRAAEWLCPQAKKSRRRKFVNTPSSLKGSPSEQTSSSSLVFALKTLINRFLNARHRPHQKNRIILIRLFYPLRSNGISSRNLLACISSKRAKKSLFFAYHRALACIKLRNDDMQCSALMIYSSKSEIYSFSDG